jgi:signal transduction histidine kinase
MGLAGSEPGDDYRDFLEQQAATNADSAKVLAGFDDVANGRAARFRHVYAATKLTHGLEFRISISPIELEGRPLILFAAYDTTLQHPETDCPSLQTSLLRVQALERRRIGRDLHDSTSQLVVGLGLSLIRLKPSVTDPCGRSIIAEIEDTLSQVHREIRAISYLLHPPSLQNSNLVDAIETLVNGFAKRAHLDIVFDFEGRRGRWDKSVEAALYRLAQEALANVQRHAHATGAIIRLVSRPTGHLHLVIEDDGIGISRDLPNDPELIGVGIAGMKERISELGGRFSIRCCGRGTRIVASVPAGRAANGRRGKPKTQRPRTERPRGLPTRRGDAWGKGAELPQLPDIVSAGAA